VAFGPAAFNQLYGSFYSASTNFILSAIPMFILMGALLERSGIAERLFRVMNMWLGRLPAGLALATIAMGAIFAAAAGVVGAVEVMIGMMAIPAMQRRSEEHRLNSSHVKSSYAVFCLKKKKLSVAQHLCRGAFRKVGPG